MSDLHRTGNGAGMVGWEGIHPRGLRPTGVHPLASVGGPPENRAWMIGDPTVAPEIASSALVNAFCTVDAAMPDGTPTFIGERTFLQARVHVGHNAVVGNDCEICAGVVICGHVQIGNGVRIGGNSWIKPRVTIGDGAVIGGGSVVTKDVPAHEVWAGNPARPLKLAWTHPASQERIEAAQSGHFPSAAEISEYVDLEMGLGAGVGGDHA